VDADFWHARWEQGAIGFHLEEVNPHLTAFWDGLGVPGGQRVLVPLCGKSHDLRWLANRGHSVIGVELSPIAVRDFFAEQGLDPVVRREGAFDVCAAAGIELWCGDFFALTPADVAGVAAVYDRAALVALPPALRTRYVEQLATLLPGGVPTLLVTLDYPATAMSGPPFAVADTEVEQRFGPGFDVTRLFAAEVPLPGKAAAGSMHEAVWRLLPRPLVTS
jgi:thiopurine S-methyltransferase